MIEHQTESNGVDRVLEKNGLKKTHLRRAILLAFSMAKKPLTQADLISALALGHKSVDRVSVYRNLSSLKEAGILHEVDTNKYVMCSHERKERTPHLLLFCQKCHKHEEINDLEQESILLSALDRLGFFDKEQPVSLKGVCSACSP